MSRLAIRTAPALALLVLVGVVPRATSAATWLEARSHIGGTGSVPAGIQDAEAPRLVLDARLTTLEVNAAPDPQATWTLANDVLDTILANSDTGADHFDTWSRARALLILAGFPDHAANLDQVLASGLMVANRGTEAEAHLGSAFKAYSGHTAALALLHATRADLFRVGADWNGALAELDRADSKLAELEELDWLGLVATTRALGVRVQVETFLGRLDRAWALSQLEVDAARGHLDEHPAIAADALAAARYRNLDLRLSVGRYASIVAETSELLEVGRSSPDDPGQLRMFRALALAGEAMQRGTDHERAAIEVRAVLADQRASEVERLNLLIALARLEKHGDGWAAMAGTLSAARKLIGEGDGQRIAPARETARVLALEAALARGTGAEPAELRVAFSALEEAIAALLERWDALPNLPGGVGYLHDEGRRTLVGECLELGLALGAEERAFEIILALQARGALTNRAGAKGVDLAALRHGPLAQGGALVFIPTLAVTYLVVVDADVLQVHRLAPERALRETVRAVRAERLLGRAAELELSKLGAALIPLAVHARIAKWEHTFISGAGLLGNPNFEALPYLGGRLGELVSLGYAPSLQDLVVGPSNSPRPVGPGSFALWALPEVTSEARARWPELVPFDDVDSAVRWMTNAHGKGVVWGRAAGEATRGAFLDQDLADVRVLNILAHGVFADERAVPAGLAMAAAEGDGIVWAADLALMELPELVVLAVCGGARGPARFGQDGVQHLGGAVLAGGAQAVLLARGEVAVGATLEALGYFERALAGGLSPIAALREARVEFASKHGSAVQLEPFFILGAGHKPLFPESPERDGVLLRSAWGLGFLLALCLLARRAWLSRRG